MKIILFIFFIINFIYSQTNNSHFIETEFKKYLIKYKKKYSTEEDYLKHFNAFNSSYYKINQHNNNTNHSFKLGLNKFSDLTSEDKKKYKSSIKIDDNINKKKTI